MKGELFFFNSNYNIPEGYNKFKSGHIGISFDRDLSPKKIYGFGPIDTNFLDSDNSSSIEGIVKDDTNYFKQYFYECSSNSPLYKINISFNPSNKNDFFKTKSTYSHPLISGATFKENIDSLEKYNNCITFLINTIKPVIDNDIVINLTQIDHGGDVGWYPGGYIYGFIEKYKKYAKIVKSFE